MSVPGCPPAFALALGATGRMVPTGRMAPAGLMAPGVAGFAGMAGLAGVEREAGRPIRGFLLGSMKLTGVMGRFTPVAAAGATNGFAGTTGRIVGVVLVVVAPPHELLFSHCAMNCSKAIMGATPAFVTNFSMTYRRLEGGSSFASIIFVLDASSLCLATKRAMSWSSAAAPPGAAPVAAFAPAAPRVVTVGFTSPLGMMPGIIGLTPVVAVMPTNGAAAFGRCGMTTSSSGTASGAPASLLCASMSCRSVFIMSSRQTPFLL
mmetsp:Transcript_8245/g.18836  ORF Transcript_8245/g.18836 Transcript_8245/m.18836 type:complete len:263 (+) Transcript_8245:241-1029(+)